MNNLVNAIETDTVIIFNQTQNAYDFYNKQEKAFFTVLVFNYRVKVVVQPNLSIQIVKKHLWRKSCKKKGK